MRRTLPCYLRAAMRAWRWLWLALFVAPLFVGIGDSSVWDSNESFYVQTPREMLQRGDWIVPYFNGSKRLNKPPLSYWLVGTFYKILGVSLWTERLCMALLAAGSVLAVFWLGRLLFDVPTALLGAAIFSTCFRFLMISRRLLIDVLLLLLILLAVASLLHWLQRPSSRGFHLFSAFLGLAFLAKGPVALLVLLFLVPYVWITARDRLPRAPYGGAAALFALIALPWFAALGWRAGWDAVFDFFFIENVGRFTHLDFGPDRGPLFFVGVFLADFFPWSILLAAGAAKSLWRWRSERSDGLLERAGGRPELLLLLWVVVWLFVFSLSHNKQEYYLLPLYPAAALLVADCLRNRRPSKWPAFAAGLVLLFVAALLFSITNVLFEGVAWLWLPPLILSVWIIPATMGRWLPSCAVLSLFFFSAFNLYLEPLEEYRPARHFAESIRKLEVETGERVQVGYYRYATPSLSFYLNRPVFEFYDPELAAAQLDSDEKTLLVVQPGDLGELDRRTSKALTVSESRPRFSTSLRSLRRVFAPTGNDGKEALLRPVYLIQNW